jgi:protein ImuB
MRIPSYDDLERGIPDISMRESFAQVERLLSSRPLARAEVQAPSQDTGAAPSQLFACLRSPRTPEIIAGIARDFSPRIERHGTTDVVLDVSGLGRLLGDPQAIGAELERTAASRASGIRVAVAPTQTAARLLAIAHRGLTVRSDAAPASLAGLPIAVLSQLMEEDLPALSTTAEPLSRRAKRLRRMIETFQRWGLNTLGEVAGLPAAELSQRMGQEGLLLQRRATGLDTAPLVPDPGVPRYIQTLELEWPIDALEPLSFVLPRLLDPLSTALERADRGAAAIRINLRLTDRTMHTRVLQLPAAMRDARVLRTLLLLDLESHPPSAAIDIITIEIDPAPGRIIQYSLLERATPSAETMATLMARLGALVGEDRCGTPVLLDTHRPDGFEMRIPAAGSKRVIAPAMEERSRLEAESAGPQLRRFRPPVAVRVTVERGCPVHVAIDRRGMPGGRVEQYAGPWRTSGAWWDAAGTQWDRDEWDVAVADAVMCRIFRDRASGQWFIEGILD